MTDAFTTTGQMKIHIRKGNLLSWKLYCEFQRPLLPLSKKVASFNPVHYHFSFKTHSSSLSLKVKHKHFSIGNFLHFDKTSNVQYCKVWLKYYFQEFCLVLPVKSLYHLISILSLKVSRQPRKILQLIQSVCTSLNFTSFPNKVIPLNTAFI